MLVLAESDALVLALSEVDVLTDTEVLVEVLTDWLSLSERCLLAFLEASSDMDWLWLTETDKLSA